MVISTIDFEVVMGKRKAAKAFNRWERQQEEQMNRRQRRVEEQNRAEEESRLQAAVRAVAGPTPDLTYQGFTNAMQVLANQAQQVPEAIQAFGQSSTMRQIIETISDSNSMPNLLGRLVDWSIVPRQEQQNQQVSIGLRRPVDSVRGPMYLESVSMSQSQWGYVRDMNRGRMPAALPPDRDFDYLEGCACPSCTARRNSMQAEIERGYVNRLFINGTPPSEAQRLYQNVPVERPYLDYRQQKLIIPGGSEVTFEAMASVVTESPEFNRWLFLTVPIGLQQEVREIIYQFKSRNRPLGRSVANDYFEQRITGALGIPGPVILPVQSSVDAIDEGFNALLARFASPNINLQPKPKPPEEIDQMRAKVARAQKLLQDTSRLLSRVVAGLEVTPEEAKALKARVDAGVAAFK